MSIGEKLTKIAGNMKDVYGRGYATGSVDGYEQGYFQGAENGGIAAREQCLMTHYADVFFGNGTGKLLLNVPFKPDIITVYTTHSYSKQMPNCYRGFVIDLRACGSNMGNFFYTGSDSSPRCGLIPSDLSGKNIGWDSGVFKMETSMEQLKDLCWMPFVRYHLVAVKFPDESGRQLLEEQILLLPDQPPQGSSGRLTYVKSVVESYMTLQEWEDLIAQKPNWTITLT